MRLKRGRISLREKMARNLASFQAQLSEEGAARPETQAMLQRWQDRIPAPKAHRVRRPVDGKLVRASEHQEQATVIQWWRHHHDSHRLPEFSLFAIPNGGARDPISGARLKAEGVRKGALDLMLAKPNRIYSGLFIEMKVGDNKPSDEQEKFLQYLSSAGYRCAVCWSATEAISEIEGYLRERP